MSLFSAFTFSTADGVVFGLFILAVLVISIFMSFGGKKKDGADSESYFLAGRGLPWWLIGFSLIAANISTEQFIGMSGNASQCTGLAIASFEWIAAISLVFVAFAFVPMFLRCGIYTIPQFLEYRYNKFSRTLMSLSMIVILCAVTIAVVINSGALTIDVLFSGMSVCGIPINIVTAGWFIGILAAVYVFTGGLKACAWADLLQGSGLLIGGFVIMWFAFSAFGQKDVAELGVTPDHIRPTPYQTDELKGENIKNGVTAETGVWKKFTTVNQDKLHMARPNNDPNIVWTTLLLGIWIPNLYYWGLNQYIMQRTLGAKSLAEGQKGIIFAAAMKLAIPFIIVFPGIIAFNLYHQDMAKQAESDKSANADTWVLFESIKDKATEQKKVFKFDQDFARLHQDKAEMVLTYNAAVKGAKVDELLVAQKEFLDQDGKATPVALYLANTDLLAQFAAVDYPADMNPMAKYTRRFQESIGTASATYPVQKELVGYKYDAAFPMLLRNLAIPTGFRGFVLAALLGAVISSLASMLNAASTIFTMDIYKEYIHKNASDTGLVFIGRVCVVLAMVAGCLISPILSDPRFGGLFKFIQEFQGFISPGILAIFIVGLAFTRTRGAYGVMGLLGSPILYGILMLVMPEVNYLNRMAITFVSLTVLLAILTLVFPAAEAKALPSNDAIELTNSKGAIIAGVLVCIATIALYVVFF